MQFQFIHLGRTNFVFIFNQKDVGWYQVTVLIGKNFNSDFVSLPRET